MTDFNQHEIQTFHIILWQGKYFYASLSRKNLCLGKNSYNFCSDCYKVPTLESPAVNATSMSPHRKLHFSIQYTYNNISLWIPSPKLFLQGLKHTIVKDVPSWQIKDLTQTCYSITMPWYTKWGLVKACIKFKYYNSKRRIKSVIGNSKCTYEWDSQTSTYH